MERWRGKVAVVTGASSGIGLATAKQLVQNGLIVIGLARRVDQMKEAMKDVKGSGEFHAKRCDVSDEKEVTDVFDWIISTFKTIHILVNNAGFVKLNTIEGCSTEDIETTFKVNVFGLLYCTKQAIKLMRENQCEAHIINVNSILGHRVYPQLKLGNVYPASKFAVTALSESLTNELTDTKIRITNISPGRVLTEMFTNPTNTAVLNPEDISNSIVHAISAPAHVEINEITVQPKKTLKL